MRKLPLLVAAAVSIALVGCTPTTNTGTSTSSGYDQSVGTDASVGYDSSSLAGSGTMMSGSGAVNAGAHASSL